MGARARRFGAVALAGALTAVLAGGPGSGAAAATGDRDAVRQAMAAVTAAGAAGVQVRIHDEHGDWTGSAGVRTLRGGTVPTDGRFRVGSITKAFVSTVVLQLVDEGALALDDPAAGYLPEYGLDPRITVRMLLQHTSGLFNHTGEPRPDGTIETGIPLYGADFAENRFRTYRPDELIAVALAKPARFEPGTSWSYSNTNYVLAGQLVERLTGTSYATQVRQRVLRPLGLRETLLPGTWPGLPHPHAHGYYAYRQDGRPRVLDVARVNPTWAGSAGEVISTTRDLDRFIAALFGGELLPADLLAEMRAPLWLDPVNGYGLGLETANVGPGCGGVFQGHTGGVHGYQSYLFSNGDQRFEISVTVGAVDTSDPGAADRLGTAMGNLLLTITCGTPPKADRPEFAGARMG
jgi:D-alanyl-D-alanine carboxypeptidase